MHIRSLFRFTSVDAQPPAATLRERGRERVWKKQQLKQIKRHKYDTHTDVRNCNPDREMEKIIPE